jgi:hypothetical protein
VLAVTVGLAAVSGRVSALGAQAPSVRSPRVRVSTFARFTGGLT